MRSEWIRLLVVLSVCGSLQGSVLPAVSYADAVPQWQQGLGQAASAMERGDLRGAEKQYRLVLQQAPGQVDACLGLASALVAEKRIAEAQGLLEGLIARQPGLQPAYYLLGLIYETQGQDDRAKAAYSQYVAIAPGNVSPAPQVRIKLRQLGIF